MKVMHPNLGKDLGDNEGTAVTSGRAPCRHADEAARSEALELEEGIAEQESAMARGAILDSDSDDGAAPEEELAEERDVLEDQYAHEAKPMGKYEVRTMTVNDVKGRYRRYEKCELAWRNGKKVTVGFGWCIKVPYQRPEGTALSDEILLSLCVVSEILVEELPRTKATEGDTALGDVKFKVAWLYSLGELVNDFPQYVHHRRQYPENERFFQVPMYPGDHQLQVYDDVDFTSVRHRPREHPGRRRG